MWHSGIQFKVYQAILAGKVKLPNLPDNTMKLRHILANPNFNLKDLLVSLHANPEIAAVVLSAANSTVFYGARPTDDLHSAVVRLGASTVTSIVLTHSLETTLVSPDLPLRHVIRGLWQDTIRVGSLCMTIARKMSTSSSQLDSDKALLAGVTHHMGTLLLLSYLHDRQLALPTAEEVDGIPSDLAANIAAVLARQWRLDEDVLDCIKARNNFEELTPGLFSIQDTYQLAVLLHRIHDKKEGNLPSLDQTVPIKKAAFHGLLGTSLDLFITDVMAQADVIYDSLVGGMVASAANNKTSSLYMTAAQRYCA